MLLSLYQVVLAVSDIDQAETFYSHLLGIPGRRVSPGQHHFDCGGMILNCYEPPVDGDSPQAPFGPHQLYFVVEDLEAVFERAKTAGCTSLDEQIVTQPWGNRSFSAEDPFKNFIGFVDETTAIQQTGEQSAAGPDDGLKVGCALSIQSIEGETEKQAAAITKIFKEEIWLHLAQPPPDLVFEEGEKVSIQYGNGDAVLSSETEIVKIVPLHTEYLAISIPEEAKTLQRRAIPRIQSEVPVSFSVLSSADGGETSGEAFDSKTHDISTGGLRFDTSLSLKEGDELNLKLLLSPSQEISVHAKVMGTKQVKRQGTAVTLVGTQFVEMHLDDQIKLLQFLIGEEEAGEAAAEAAKSPKEEPKAAPEAAKSPKEEPKAAPEALKSQEKELRLAPEAVKSPKEEPTTAAEAAKSQEKELRLAPEAVKSPKEEPKAAPGVVRSQEKDSKAEVKELSWFAAQINKPVKGGGGVKTTGPTAVKSETVDKAVRPIVQALPTIQSGKAFLELSNGYHQPVTVKDVFAAKGAGSLTPLLAEPKQLSPGETQRFDVTEPLLPLFNRGVSETQDKLVQILLALEPEPPDQPAPSRYLLRFEKETFTKFSSE